MTQLESDDRASYVYLAWLLKPGKPQIIAVCSSREIAKRYEPNSEYPDYDPEARFHVERFPLDHHFGSRDIQSAIYRAALRRVG